MRRTSALIIGGGPAGSAAAITLARAGAMPVVIERTAEPRDIVCGGFLGWDALGHLHKLGVDPSALGARPIGRVRMIAGARIVDKRLPKLAAGLSRKALDAALLRIAQEAGAVVLRGRAARAAEGRNVRLDDGEEMSADALFVATGKHELRGVARDFGDRKVSVGLRAAFMPSLETARDLAGTVELHLYDGGYAGLLLQEDGKVNLCLSVAQARMSEGRETLLAALMREAPALADRMGGQALDWEAIAGVPYGWRARTTGEGVYRVGDQAAVTASVAGDGVAIALASGIAAAQDCLQGGRTGAFQTDFARRAARPIRAAELLRHMVEHPGERGVMMGLARVGGLARLWARLMRIG